MICEICGKNYIALGVHIKVKHKIHLNDYRRDFDIPFTQSLVDEELGEHLSRQAKLRLLTEEGKAHMKLLDQVKSTDGNPGPRDLPKCTKENLHKRLNENNDRKSKVCRKNLLPKVLPDWIAGMTSKEIAKKHNMAPATLRKWQREGHLPKRELKYVLLNNN